MQIRCPHCQVAIELVDCVAGTDLTCPKCGSHIISELATMLDPVSGDQTIVDGQSPTEPPDEKYFGRFRLLTPLGRGSFGEVWLADDPKLERQVALKFPRPGKQKNFWWEAQAAAKLRHPNIVTVFEVGKETYNGQPNWPYIASEYIPSQDLAKVLKAELEQGRAFPPKRVAEICRKVAEALHTAHQAGVVHCDLKPANILMARSGPIHGVNDRPDESGHYEPYLTDFGLARRDAEPVFTLTTPNVVESLRDSNPGHGVTGIRKAPQGPTGGTPGYSSPEQWQGKAIDGRTDVWALGIILFELLTGERPFRAERDLKLLRDQILHDDPQPPSQLNSQVPADLDTLCLKCLAKDPSLIHFATVDARFVPQSI